LRAQRGDQEIVDIPREYHTYLGGHHAMHDLCSIGGLWQLCYLDHPVKTDDVNFGTFVLDFLRYSYGLPMWLLRLRCSVELVDSLLTISPCRIGGANGDMLFNAADTAAVSRMRSAIEISYRSSTYATTKAYLLYTLFGSTHGVILEQMGCRSGVDLLLRPPSPTCLVGLGVISFG